MRGLYSLEPSCANRLERIDFYRKMLGIEPSKVRTGYAKFDIQNPPLNLALNEVPDLAARSALSHLGLHVASTDDVLAIRTRWAEAGLVTRDENADRLLLRDAGQDLGARAWIGVSSRG